VTGATLGKTAALAGAFTIAELKNLKFSVDEAYRGDAEWMFSDDVLEALELLEDADGRPLWAPGLTAGAPDRLLQHGYVVNNDMPTIATGNKPVLFGDMSKFFIRDVAGIRIKRLNERFADNDQVAFVAFSRHDALLHDAGTNPVKYLQMA